MEDDDALLLSYDVDYMPRSHDYVKRTVGAVFNWLSTSKHKNKIDMARREIFNRFLQQEEDILAYFAEYEGGKDYVHKDEAWRLACRQREFTREVCARMAEGDGGVPTALSEAIRDLNLGENVKVIPDYSKTIGAENG